MALCEHGSPQGGLGCWHCSYAVHVWSPGMMQKKYRKNIEGIPISLLSKKLPKLKCRRKMWTWKLYEKRCLKLYLDRIDNLWTGREGMGRGREYGAFTVICAYAIYPWSGKHGLQFGSWGSSLPETDNFCGGLWPFWGYHRGPCQEFLIKEC